MEEIVTMRQLLECGVHFGHQTKRWNPKMKRYIFTARNEIHVIDLQQTIKLIRTAYDFVKDVVSKGGKVLFVGTKKQAQDAIKLEAEQVGMFFVNQRWLGGTLTNNVTLLKSINKLKEYEKMEADGVFEKLSKKEASRRKKTLARLRHYLAGIKDMVKLPGALFVVDTKKEALAVKEANILGIPIIGIVDTNADPTEVQYPIPANDDAIRAIKLITSVIASACSTGQGDQATVMGETTAEGASEEGEKKAEKIAVDESEKAADTAPVVAEEVAQVEGQEEPAVAEAS